MNYNEYIKTFPVYLLNDIKAFITQLASLHNDFAGLAKLVEMGAFTRKANQRKLTLWADYPKFKLADMDDIIVGKKLLCVRFNDKQFDLIAEFSPDFKEITFYMYAEFAGVSPSWVMTRTAAEFATDIDAVLIEQQYKAGMFNRAMPSTEEYLHVAHTLNELKQFLEQHELHIVSADHNWALVKNCVNLDDNGTELPDKVQSSIWELCSLSAVTDYDRLEDNLFIV